MRVSTASGIPRAATLKAASAVALFTFAHISLTPIGVKTRPRMPTIPMPGPPLGATWPPPTEKWAVAAKKEVPGGEGFPILLDHLDHLDQI